MEKECSPQPAVSANAAKEREEGEAGSRGSRSSNRMILRGLLGYYRSGQPGPESSLGFLGNWLNLSVGIMIMLLVCLKGFL